MTSPTTAGFGICAKDDIEKKCQHSDNGEFPETVHLPSLPGKVLKRSAEVEFMVWQ
jgi:hypothetical protein